MSIAHFGTATVGGGGITTSVRGAGASGTTRTDNEGEIVAVNPLTVQVTGQTLTVSMTTSGGVAPSYVFTDQALTTLATWPATITADTTWWLSGEQLVNISVLESAVELGPFTVTGRGGGNTLTPRPTGTALTRVIAAHGTAIAGLPSTYVRASTRSELSAESSIVVSGATAVNASAALSITAYDSSSNVTHPSVYFTPNGWNGHRYWMALTPYDGVTDSMENPSIYCSDDGNTWAPPTGLTNPVIGTPSGGYNSDPDVVMVDGVLHMFSRQQFDALNLEQYVHCTSSDGVTWTTPTVVMTFAQDGGIRPMSSSFVYDGSNWLMFGVNITPNPNTIVRSTASSPSGPWTTPTAVTITHPVSGRDWWHMDVIKVGGQLIALVYDADSGVSANGDLYLCSSVDDGLTWTVSPKPVLYRYINRWDTSLYRSTLWPAYRDGKLGFDIWYSASSPQWRIGRSFISLDSHAATVHGNAHGARDVGSLRMLAANAAMYPYLGGDSFARADSTSGLGTASDGVAWTATTNVMGISGKRAYSYSNTNTKVTRDIGSANMALSMDLDTLGTGEGWLVARYQDANNFWRYGNSGSATLKLQKVIAGVTTDVLTRSGLVDGDRISLAVNAGNWTLYVNDRPIGQATDSALSTATVAGIQCSRSDVRIANWIARLPINGLWD